ncbi:MAG: hypothetical protein OEM05_15395, partial [Myxococcales bacterium]|nr:hypothetical protein [Myxococcales bacterium]
AVLVSLPLLVHPWYDSTYGDPALYIETARALVAGEGYTHLGLSFRLRPPGFSVLIAPIIAGLGTHFYALNLFVSLLGAAGVVLLAFHLRATLGGVVAALTAFAVWLNPGYQWHATQILSDVPGTSALIACLLLEQWARRAPSWRREAVLGVCVGLAAYLRSINLLLVPAIVVSRLLQRRRDGMSPAFTVSVALRDLALFAAVAWLVLLPWSIRENIKAPPSPADQTYLYSYATGMWHRDPGDPASPRVGAAGLLARMRANAPAIVRTLGSRMQAGRHPALNPALGLLLLGASLVLLLRRRAPAEFFVVFALGVLVGYFDLRDRLLLPVFVLALSASVEVVRDLLGRIGGARVANAGAAAALLLLVAFDFEPRRGWDRIEKRHTRYAQMTAAVAAQLEPDARIGAGVGFHYGVYLERPVYSLAFAIRRDHRPEAAEAIIDKYGLNTLVSSPLAGAELPLLPYFEKRYGNVRRAGEATVIRVRP